MCGGGDGRGATIAAGVLRARRGAASTYLQSDQAQPANGARKRVKVFNLHVNNQFGPEQMSGQPVSRKMPMRSRVKISALLSGSAEAVSLIIARPPPVSIWADAVGDVQGASALQSRAYTPVASEVVPRGTHTAEGTRRKWGRYALAPAGDGLC
jgi:hypothetical protein